MAEQLSSEAIALAATLADSPALDGLWRGDLAACWEAADEDDPNRDAIEIYEVVGIDASPTTGQKSIHGHHVATLSVQEAREKHDHGDVAEAAAARSADAA